MADMSVTPPDKGRVHGQYQDTGTFKKETTHKGDIGKSKIQPMPNARDPNKNPYQHLSMAKHKVIKGPAGDSAKSISLP